MSTVIRAFYSRSIRIGLLITLLLYIALAAHSDQTPTLTVEYVKDGVTMHPTAASPAVIDINEELQLTVKKDGNEVGLLGRPLLRWDINQPDLVKFRAAVTDTSTTSPINGMESVFFSARRAGDYPVTVRLRKQEGVDEYNGAGLRFIVRVNPPSKIQFSPAEAPTLYEHGPKYKLTATSLNRQGKPLIGNPVIRVNVTPPGAVQVTNKDGQPVDTLMSGDEVNLEGLVETSGAAVTFSDETGKTTASLSLFIKKPTVEITGPPKDSRKIREGEMRTVTAVIKAGQDEITDRKPEFRVVTGGDSLIIDKVTGQATAQSKPGPATVEAKDVKTGAISTIPFDVVAKGSTLEVDPPGGVVFLGKPATLHVRIFDKNHQPVSDASEWTIEPTVKPDNASVSVSGDTITLTPQKIGNLVLSITATSPDKVQVLKTEIPLSTPQVTGFKPVKVAMDIVDYGTVQYLFGSQVAKDFHVLRVRLFNNLRSDDGTTNGDAILAYSESIEMRVRLEKRFNPKYNSQVDKSSIPPRGVWAELLEGDVVSGFTRAYGNDENAFPRDRQRYQFRSGGEAIPGAGAPIRGILTLKPGEASYLSITERNGLPAYGNIEWISTDPSIATVDKTTGMVKALQTGMVHIQARFSGIGAAPLDLAVVVFQPASQDTKVALLPMSTPLLVNLPRQVEFEKGKAPSKYIEWKSDKPYIVNVDDRGILTPLTAGEASIHVKFGKDKQDKDMQELVMPVLVIAESLSDLPPSVYYDGSELERLRHRFLYRPYSYEMMVNSLDQRGELSTRNKWFRIADLLGTSVSFFNSVGGLRGADTSLILDKYSNFLIPNLKRIYPDMRATERQNFVSMAMRPIEEIPFGSDIARVLFVPKQPIEGMLRGYDVRISEVDTSYFNITVAIIKKTNSDQTGNVAK